MIYTRTVKVMICDKILQKASNVCKFMGYLIPASVVGFKEYKTYEHVQVLLDLTVGLPGSASCGVYVSASVTTNILVSCQFVRIFVRPVTLKYGHH